MDAGGIITRVKHGEADELMITSLSGNTVSESLLNTSYMSLNPSRGPLQNVSPAQMSPGDFNDLISKQGQFDLMYSASADANAATLYDTEPDEFVFNFNGFSGKFVYNSSTQQYVVETNSSETFKITSELKTDLKFIDPSVIVPRCIIKFTLETHDGYIYEFGGNYETDHNVELYLGMPRFGTAGNGAVTDRERGNNIYTSSWYLSKVTSPKGVVADFVYDREGYTTSIYPAINLEQLGGNTAANGGVNNNRRTNYNKYATPVNTASYLSRITAGPITVSFTRKKTNYVITGSQQTNWKDVNCFEEVVPDYVGRIGSDANYRKTKLTEYYAAVYPNVCIQDSRLLMTFANEWQKLVQVDITENGERLYRYDFEYYQKTHYHPTTGVGVDGGSQTGRLELKSIYKSASDVKQDDPKPYFAFKYYDYNLYQEGYGTRKVDHWGFYNAQDFFGTPRDTSGIFVDQSLATAYAATRTPHCNQTGTGNCGSIGALVEITYPTGGISRIEYESNDYRTRIAYDKANNVIAPVAESANRLAGGYRVKSVTSYGTPDINGTFTTPLKKEYFYVNNYLAGGTGSSGVLNSGIPTYWYECQSNAYENYLQLYGSQVQYRPNLLASFQTLSSTPSFPDFFNGSFLNYSNVIEKNADGSFIIHKFSNSDNSAAAGAPNYIDKVVTLPGNGTNPYTKNGLKFQWFISKNAQRGKLLNQSYYNAHQTLVKQVDYLYNENEPQAVNAMRKEGVVLGIPVGNANYYALQSYLTPHYTYNGYLKQKTEKLYDNLGNFISQQIVQSSYDDYRNLTHQTATVDGQTDVQTVYTYPNSLPAAPSNTGNSFLESVRNLQDKKLYNYPVEETKFVRSGSSWYVTGSKLTEYRTDKPIVKKQSVLELSTPGSNFSGISIANGTYSRDTRYKDKSLITDYSPSYNYPLTVTTDDISTAVIRSTDEQQITATATNARSADIAYTGFEYPQSAEMGNWQFVSSAIKDASNERLFTGHSFPLYTHNITSRPTLEAGKTYTVSLWYKQNGGYPQVKNGSQTVDGVMDGSSHIGNWYYREYTFVAQGSWISIVGSNDIDELRLYPQTSKMTTYTYDDKHRVIVKTDPLNKTLLYNYDDWGRLTEVRDGNNVNPDGTHNLLKKVEYKLNEIEQ